MQQKEDVDIFDIRLTAGRWNTSGAYTSSHTHWGEAWMGTGSHGLRLDNTTASGTAYGVHGMSVSTGGRHVYGLVTATSGVTYGTYGGVCSRSEFYPARSKQPAAGDDPSALMGERPEASDSVHRTPGEVAPGDYLLGAVSGMAQVRVEPGVEDLAPGARLVMGDVPGRLKAAGEGANPSIAFARALESRPDENDLVWALIMLQ